MRRHGGKHDRAAQADYRGAGWATRPAQYNPVVLERANEYQTEEGCLSLPGTRPATRWRRIRVEYLDEDFALRTSTFSGYTAQIIQHEIDHCNGVLV